MTLKIVPPGTVHASLGHRFNGTTLTDVAKGAKLYREAASISWDLKLRYYEKGSQIINVDLTLIVTMKMPVWINYSSRPKPEKDEWNRFYKALRYHEDAHHALLKREANTAYLKLRDSKTAADLTRAHQSESDRLQKLNDEFDLKVGHGTRQASPYGNTVINI